MLDVVYPNEGESAPAFCVIGVHTLLGLALWWYKFHKDPYICYNEGVRMHKCVRLNA